MNIDIPPDNETAYVTTNNCDPFKKILEDNNQTCPDSYEIFRYRNSDSEYEQCCKKRINVDNIVDFNDDIDNWFDIENDYARQNDYNIEDDRDELDDYMEPYFNHNNNYILLRDSFKQEDPLLNDYRDVAILYTYNGNNLINNYIINNYSINTTIIRYFLEKYRRTFSKYSLRDCLRVKPIGGDRFIDCFIDGCINNFDSLFNLIRPQTFSFYVYRGISIKKHIIDGITDINDIDDMNFIRRYYPIDSLLKFKTYSSTSLSLGRAVDFIGGGDDNEGDDNEGVNNIPIIFKITIPNGSKTIPVLRESKFNREYEIILNRNSIFYVESINNDHAHDPVDPYYCINMILIDNFEKYAIHRVIAETMTNEITEEENRRNFRRRWDRDES